jgi:glucose-1-phosphate thymidylyltransferase
MKGIILEGGSGTRLHPITKGISKQLLPIYNKPMIFYSLSLLMLAKIKEVLIITNPQYLANYQALLGDGSHLGMHFEYCIQDKPNGLAEAFILGENFVGSSSVALALGDNFIFGSGLAAKLANYASTQSGATIFAHQVVDPHRFGVVEFDEHYKVLSIEEKPLQPKSNYAIIGLYFYDNKVIEYAKAVKPSLRGELEITDINQMYLDKQALKVETLGRGFTYFDMGTQESLLEASMFVQTIEKNQGLQIANLEEIAVNNGWIKK